MAQKNRKVGASNLTVKPSIPLLTRMLVYTNVCILSIEIFKFADPDNNSQQTSVILNLTLRYNQHKYIDKPRPLPSLSFLRLLKHDTVHPTLVSMAANKSIDACHKLARHSPKGFGRVTRKISCAKSLVMAQGTSLSIMSGICEVSYAKGLTTA